MTTTLLNTYSLDPAAVLWALYNDAQKSPLHPYPRYSQTMNADQILEAYNAVPRDDKCHHFDLVDARPIHVTFLHHDGDRADYTDVTRYDERYGIGAAQNAIDALRLDLNMQYSIELARERLEAPARLYAVTAQ